MAEVNSIKITTEELKVVLESLKKQRDQISNIYSSQIKKVLENSSSCFTVAGMDTEMISKSIASTFKNINTNLSALIDLLENGVISKYSELSYAIQKMFTNDVTNRLYDLLGISSGARRTEPTVRIDPHTLTYTEYVKPKS